MSGKRALSIATNHGVLDIGVATGVFGSELTVPYYCFLDAGMEVDLASPLGGIVPVDPLSMKDEIRTPEDDRMLGDSKFRGKLMNSLAVADLDFTKYDIIYFAGGWGESEIERKRMHERLSNVMEEYGTKPDEIRWPGVEDYQPATHISKGGESEKIKGKAQAA